MTKRVGLIGWPVEHSVSPAMHNAAFQALGMDWRYDPLPVLPGEVGRRIDALVEAGYCGFNVTVPHKQEVLRIKQLCEAEGAVAEIGAANTLSVVEGGGLRASNTDWRGFLDDLRAHGVEVKGANCLVLGTGGSAQAVDYALRQGGAAMIRFVSRQKSGDRIIGNNIAEMGAILLSTSPLIVNCTPVGMWPNVDDMPLWGISIPGDAVVYDLIYNPPVTRLMEQAERAGARAIGGLGMLVRQGALSFEQWTGIAPPVEVMAQAAKAKLGL